MVFLKTWWYIYLITLVFWPCKSLIIVLNPVFSPLPPGRIYWWWLINRFDAFCSPGNIEMGGSGDAPFEAAGAADHVETIWPDQQTCMHGRRGMLRRCVVLCAGSEKNWEQISWIIERADLERGKCSLAFVAKSYLRVRKHLVLQPGTDRRLFITFAVVNTTAVMSFVSCSARPERRCSAAVVLYQVHLVLRRFHAKTLLLFCLPEKAWNLHNSLRKYVCSTCTTVSSSHRRGRGRRASRRRGPWTTGLECFIYRQVQLSLLRMICRVRSSEEKLREVVPGSSTLLLQPVLLDHLPRLRFDLLFTYVLLS